MSTTPPLLFLNMHIEKWDLGHQVKYSHDDYMFIMCVDLLKDYSCHYVILFMFRSTASVSCVVL